MMMETKEKFLLPSPNFGKKNETPRVSRPHFLTPSGMTLLPREKQPPPMYGPRGATVPPKYLNKYNQEQLKNHVIKEQNKQDMERQYCEACDMEMHSVEDMRYHRAQHEPCPVDSCKFRGHASIMDKHVIMLHSSGLFDKVKKLNTPEEISAWRDERRKKFPTLANVQLRQEAKAERMRRGERLEANKNRFGKREDRKRPNEMRTTQTEDVAVDEQNSNKKRQKNKQNKRKRNQRNVKNHDEYNKSQKKTIEKTEEEEEEITVPRFRGTSKMIDYEHLASKKETNALATLCMYSSSEEEEIENEKVKPLKPLEIIKNIPEDICNATNNDDDAPDEAPVERVANQPEPPAQNSQNISSNKFNKTKENIVKTPMAKRKFQRKSGLNYGKLHQRRQHTMLEKLLEHDIRHERNVLLQCVRFVVDNKFFGIGSKIPNAET